MAHTASASASVAGDVPVCVQDAERAIAAGIQLALNNSWSQRARSLLTPKIGIFAAAGAGTKVIHLLPKICKEFGQQINL